MATTQYRRQTRESDTVQEHLTAFDKFGVRGRGDPVAAVLTGHPGRAGQLTVVK